MPMLYSTTCSYAVHAVCRLAALPRDKAWRVQEICQGTNLPERFVSKILGDLVRADLLTSTKGRGGGFGLKKAPEQIRLADVVEVIDGLKPYRQCVVGLAQCNDKQPCPQHDAFAPLRQRMLRYLQETTVAQMTEAMIRKAELVGHAKTDMGLPVVVEDVG
jgi:Rrf2 family protein